MAPWQASTDPVGGSLRYRLTAGPAPLSFREVFDGFERSLAFADWYTELLAAAPFDAYFWEHPPLSETALDDPVEFVLTEAASLSRVTADPRPFEIQFRERSGEVIAFQNLGGDALLVVPRPSGPHSVYAHLAAFVRGAPRAQARALWAGVSAGLRQVPQCRPCWLSTAGLGVPWLHVRLDAKPKYYRYRPYTAAGRFDP